MAWTRRIFLGQTMNESLITVPCDKCGGSGRLPDNQQIGKQMRQARELSGHSQREVARRMGFSAAYINDLEFGRRRWTPRASEIYRRAIKA